MKSLITLTILNLIALYYAYNSGKKHKENEILANGNRSNNRNKSKRRIGDLEEIKRRLNNNEF